MRRDMMSLIHVGTTIVTERTLGSTVIVGYINKLGKPIMLLEDRVKITFGSVECNVI